MVFGHEPSTEQKIYKSNISINQEFSAENRTSQSMDESSKFHTVVVANVCSHKNRDRSEKIPERC